MEQLPLVTKLHGMAFLTALDEPLLGAVGSADPFAGHLPPGDCWMIVDE